MEEDLTQRLKKAKAFLIQLGSDQQKKTLILAQISKLHRLKKKLKSISYLRSDAEGDKTQEDEQEKIPSSLDFQFKSEVKKEAIGRVKGEVLQPEREALALKEIVNQVTLDIKVRFLSIRKFFVKLTISKQR